MRLVSLCPSITESLVALGLAGELAGITRYCVHPREVVARIPKIGGTKNPDLAAIRAAAPDLVFANGEENRKEDVEALARDFSVDVSHPRTVSEVPPLLRHFGRLTGAEAKAEEIASKVEDEVRRIDSASRPFRYVYLIWKDPWMTVGPRTYVADLLCRVGGSLSLDGSSDAGAPDYPVTSEEEIVASRPDLLILPDEPYRFREEHATFWRRRLPASCRVVVVPGEDFCWHGVRTLRGLDAAAALGATGAAG